MGEEEAQRFADAFEGEVGPETLRGEIVAIGAVKVARPGQFQEQRAGVFLGVSGSDVTGLARPSVSSSPAFQRVEASANWSLSLAPSRSGPASKKRRMCCVPTRRG